MLNQEEVLAKHGIKAEENLRCMTQQEMVSAGMTKEEAKAVWNRLWISGDIRVPEVEAIMKRINLTNLWVPK